MKLALVRSWMSLPPAPIPRPPCISAPIDDLFSGIAPGEIKHGHRCARWSKIELERVFRRLKVEMRFDGGDNFNVYVLFHSLMSCAIFQLFNSIFSFCGSACAVCQRERDQARLYFDCFFFAFSVWFGVFCLRYLHCGPLDGVINVFVGICVNDLVSFSFCRCSISVKLHQSKPECLRTYLFRFFAVARIGWAVSHFGYCCLCRRFFFVLFHFSRKNVIIGYDEEYFDLLWLWLGALFL